MGIDYEKMAYYASQLPEMCRQRDEARRLAEEWRLRWCKEKPGRVVSEWQLPWEEK